MRSSFLLSGSETFSVLFPAAFLQLAAFVTQLDNNVSDIEDKISQLNDDIDKKTKEIDQSRKELEEAERVKAEQYAAMKKRVKEELGPCTVNIIIL